MAEKKVPQEDCLMCGEFPCVCGGSERRTRVIKRQVESAFLDPSLQEALSRPDTSGQIGHSDLESDPGNPVTGNAGTSADSTDDGDPHGSD